MSNMEQIQAQINEAVAAGTMSQEDADNMIERQASRIDDIIDGKMPSGGPGGPPRILPASFYLHLR
jgi:hypothetical protein